MVTALSPQGSIFGVGTMHLLTIRKQPEIPHLILPRIRQRGLDPKGHASEAGEGLAMGSSVHASFC
jgi:hypothetical protein